MKFQLAFNDEVLDGVLDSEEAVKAYLTHCNNGKPFAVEDKLIDVDAFFDMLKNEIGAVSCYSPAMCEMGDDYVEVELIIVPE